jgi:demethylmenaquinone methyltransferase/2-methoxy-6-polyprenyl-1,4-benzoquinol methylase
LWSGLFESRAAGRAYRAAGLCGGERVLEVAVGGGEFFARLAKTPGLKQCAGVDLSAPMLNRAHRQLAAGGIARSDLCRANALALPFGDEVFDILFNLYMMDLLLMEDVPAVLGEFARVLRPGGRLIVLSMAQQLRMVNGVWMWLYRRSPVLTGGCRPLPVAGMLEQNGWKISLCEAISQAGFRSELVVAQFMPEVAQ